MRERFYELKDGRVKDLYQIRDAYYIVYGKKFDDVRIINSIGAIVREITDPNEWKAFAPTDKVGAMKLYRELTGCGLVEAKRTVDEYLEREESK